MHELFLQKLAARGPHPSLGDHAQTYARLIGSWSGELTNHLTAGKPALAGLEARAVQDVWITPAPPEQQPARAGALAWYGSTLRVFEPALEAWRTVWTDPLSQLRIELIGRRHGDDIVQLGTRGGRPIRWTFS